MSSMPDTHCSPVQSITRRKDAVGDQGDGTPIEQVAPTLHVILQDTSPASSLL